MGSLSLQQVQVQLLVEPERVEIDQMEPCVVYCVKLHVNTEHLIRYIHHKHVCHLQVQKATIEIPLEINQCSKTLMTSNFL